MKKYILMLAIPLLFFACGGSYEYNLDNMGKAVRKHIMYNDIEKNLKTDIEYLKALSYEEVPENEREQPDDVYLCKVHLIAKSAYMGSYRVYNINDTIGYYFNKDMAFVRMKPQKTE